MNKGSLGIAIAALTAVLATAGCAPAEQKSAAPAGPANCDKASLATLKTGVLTFGTDQPAYPPWFVDDNPAIVRGLTILGFFSMADSRKRRHRDLMEELRAQRPALLATKVPMDTDIERMGVHRQPVTAMLPRSRPARAYEALWDEILERL